MTGLNPTGPACPTDCGRRVPNPNKVMCAPCWHEVPRELQREVYAAWRAVCHEPTPEHLRRHRAAKDAAIGSIR